MEITIEIPEKEGPFIIKLLRSFRFLKIKKQPASTAFDTFKNEWKVLCAQLPDSEADISADEIDQEIKAVRRLRREQAL